MRTSRMPRRLPIAGVLLILLLLEGGFGQPPASPAKPLVYRMELMTVFDSAPPRYAFLVTNPASNRYSCASVELLEKFIAGLPKGATLEWAPSDVRGPEGPSEKQLAEIKAFCTEMSVQFTHIPAG